MKNLTAIIRRGETPNINRNVYVTSANIETWETLKREHPGNYYKTHLVRSLYSLAINPGGRDSGTKTLKLDGAQFHYQILESGDVLIYGLQIDSSISSPVINQTTGLYRVNKTPLRWQTNDERRKSMDQSHRWAGAHYAAVSGKFDNKEEAGRLLISHILPAYKAALRSYDFTDDDYHYSLFWQDGEHKKAHNARSLAALIQQAQANNAAINWLVHGEGAGTFVQALKSLADAPGITQKVANGNQLSKQAVFFSNPRGKNTSKEELKTICANAKIELVDIQLNKQDYRNIDVRQKAFKALRTPAALTAGCASGLSDLSQAVDNFFSAPTMVGSVVVGAGAIWLATDIATKCGALFRNVKPAAKNTLGDGNKQWAA
ncbi:hypothetical protein [uncultured Microbulbifer sp.]|uniref:hypothetical protein n=1 Tax=uncultured Microbulbifer sp. TaxID=348147 RepID=UPI00260DC959|nr:hypothetical protein [uncultured Microbulbifer sp.]